MAALGAHNEEIDMSASRLEHVNITVSDPAAAARLMGDVFGWTVRWEGPALAGGRTVHVGSEDHYLALYAPPGAAAGFPKGQPLNHIGVEVDDLDAVDARVAAAGLPPMTHATYPPGRPFPFPAP